MVQLHSVETEFLQLLASQEHPTEDPTLTRSILTLNKNHEETQERYMGRKREKGRGGGEGGKAGQRKLEKGNVAVYPGLPHFLSTSVLQMTKSCSHVLRQKPGNETKPKGVLEKLQEQLVRVL